MANTAARQRKNVGSIPTTTTNKINMCLNIKPGTKKQTAKKDLYTYKWVSPIFQANQYGSQLSFKKIKAPFRKTIYDLGKLYETTIGIRGSQIHSGFHSLIEKNVKNVKTWSINGFSCYINLGMVVCKIPKGSEYYEGCKGDIVSNKIVIIGYILTPDHSLINSKDNTKIHKHCQKYLRENYPDRLVTTN